MSSFVLIIFMKTNQSNHELEPETCFVISELVWSNHSAALFYLSCVYLLNHFPELYPILGNLVENKNQNSIIVIAGKCQK